LLLEWPADRRAVPAVEVPQVGCSPGWRRNPPGAVPLCYGGPFASALTQHCRRAG
jgi:hypothetical protein